MRSPWTARRGHGRMHENSVEFITFFRDAAFKSAQGLNKIDSNRECRDDARGDDARCSRGTHGYTTQVLTGGIGSRLPRIAGRTPHLSGTGSHVLSSREGVCLTGADFLGRTLYGIASVRNLDVHAGTSDRTRPRSARHAGDGRIRILRPTRPHVFLVHAITASSGAATARAGCEQGECCSNR
jgi:hypothetical protein